MQIERKAVTIIKPVILGTYSFIFTQAEAAKRRSRGDRASHRWTCVLRAPNNEDQSYYIRKVVFVLHPSFSNSLRVVEKPPYQISEVGWGEFEIQAKVYLQDNSPDKDKPVELMHCVKLYPRGTKDIHSIKPPVDASAVKCVADETYDEIVIHHPAVQLYECVREGPKEPPLRYSMEKYFTSTEPSHRLKRIRGAHSMAQQRVVSLEAEFVRLTQEVERLKEIYHMKHPTHWSGYRDALPVPPTHTGGSPMPNQITSSSVKGAHHSSSSPSSTTGSALSSSSSSSSTRQTMNTGGHGTALSFSEMKKDAMKEMAATRRGSVIRPPQAYRPTFPQPHIRGPINTTPHPTGTPADTPHLLAQQQQSPHHSQDPTRDVSLASPHPTVRYTSVPMTQSVTTTPSGTGTMGVLTSSSTLLTGGSVSSQATRHQEVGGLSPVSLSHSATTQQPQSQQQVHHQTSAPGSLTPSHTSGAMGIDTLQTHTGHHPHQYANHTQVRGPIRSHVPVQSSSCPPLASHSHLSQQQNVGMSRPPLHRQLPAQHGTNLRLISSARPPLQSSPHMNSNNSSGNMSDVGGAATGVISASSVSSPRIPYSQSLPQGLPLPHSQSLSQPQSPHLQSLSHPQSLPQHQPLLQPQSLPQPQSLLQPQSVPQPQSVAQPASLPQSLLQPQSLPQSQSPLQSLGLPHGQPPGISPPQQPHSDATCVSTSPSPVLSPTHSPAASPLSSYSNLPPTQTPMSASGGVQQQQQQQQQQGQLRQTQPQQTQPQPNQAQPSPRQQTQLQQTQPQPGQHQIHEQEALRQVRQQQAQQEMQQQGQEQRGHFSSPHLTSPQLTTNYATTPRGSDVQAHSSAAISVDSNDVNNSSGDNISTPGLHSTGDSLIGDTVPVFGEGTELSSSPLSLHKRPREGAEGDAG